MHNLSPELYHGQVVGKMSFIVNRLERIDPENQQDEIRSDFKDELHWMKEVKDFQTILNASKSGQCNDFDTLSQKSLILQELDRLITSIQPFTMTKELVASMYHKMKEQKNLWSSFYHSRLDEIEKLNDAVNSMTPPAKYFLQAVVAKLKMHLAQNGLTRDDAEAPKLFQLAINMRDMGFRGLEAQLPLFKAFVNTQEVAPFEHVLSSEEQQVLVKSLIDPLAPKLASNTLKSILLALQASDSINKELFTTIDAIFKQDTQLKALSTITLNDQSIDETEVETLFVKALKGPESEAIANTAVLCNLLLLSKSFPQAKEVIDPVLKSSNKQTVTLSNPDLLYSIIAALVDSQFTAKDDLEFDSLNQTLHHLKEQLAKPGIIDEAMDLNQTYLFINKKVQTILDGIPQRKDRLESLGFGVPTFRRIENEISKLNADPDNGINEIVVEFYTAIQKAKETHFHNKDAVSTIKQVEHITAKEFNEFFKECCEAGEHAAQRLDGNRSGLTVVIDALKAIANWGIYLLSFGTTSQFFKKPRTAVDDVAEAVSELKGTLAATLDHLELNSVSTAAPKTN